MGSETSRKEPFRQLILLAIRNLYSWEEDILHRPYYYRKIIIKNVKSDEIIKNLFVKKVKK
jgi:hypothetical protein